MAKQTERPPGLNIGPHEMEFEPFNQFPLIASKYGKPKEAPLFDNYSSRINDKLDKQNADQN